MQHVRKLAGHWAARLVLVSALLGVAMLVATRAVAGDEGNNGIIARGAGTTIIHGGTGPSGGFVPVLTTLAFHAEHSGGGVTGTFECLALAPEADTGKGSGQFTVNAMYVTGQITGATVNRDTPRHVNNGDEERYDDFIGNYSQGLPHNSIGEVDPNAYAALLKAVRSGKSSDFGSIPLGGNTKLSNPQGGLAFSLEGTDGAQLRIPPAPTLASAERAGEHALNTAGASTIGTSIVSVSRAIWTSG